jgi:hypothetical protein
MKQHNHAGRNRARDQAVILVVVRQRSKALNAGVEHIKSLADVGLLR